MTLGWPNGKRVAVTITVMVELWSEGNGPGYGPQTVPLKSGTIDHARIAWGSYGAKEGVWRLLRILNRWKVPATFGLSGRVLELYPDMVKAVRRLGHSFAAHSYTQDTNFAYMTPEEQRAVVRRCLSLFADVIGIAPEGWMSAGARFTPHTAGILAEERLLWHGDIIDADLPRKIQTDKGVIVGIPQSDFVDNRVLHGNPMTLFDVYKETFDYLYRQEPGGMLSLLFHSHNGGRPLYAAMLDKIIEYLFRFPDVWFARHGELAQWALDNDVQTQGNYASRFFASNAESGA